MGKTKSCALMCVLLFALVGCTQYGASDSATEPSSSVRSDRVKITKDLIVVVPAQYKAVPVMGAVAAGHVYDGVSVGFDFFLPNFSGYSPQRRQSQFDENKVIVAYLIPGDPRQADPHASGQYPPNVLERLLRNLLDPNEYQDVYGLRCYEERILKNRIWCYGKRDASEYIMLWVDRPQRYMPFPQMLASYYSSRYGGVEIAWRTNAKNFARWRDIDAQIWKFIAAWNVAPRAATPAY